MTAVRLLASCSPYSEATSMASMRVRWRVAVVAAMISPLVLMGLALAQPPGHPGDHGHGNIPPPPEKRDATFRCPKCNAVVGFGPAGQGPKADRCPQCGASL